MHEKKRQEPIVLVDTTDMPENEWHEWRRKGIGGSDLAVLMNASPYSTVRDLWRKKSGIPIALEEEERNTNLLAKERGHALEPVVAAEFARQTGLIPFEDKKIFRHPVHKFMIANVDRFLWIPDGMKDKLAILECKTASVHQKDKWENEAVPLYYELQCRHYMAVNDIDVCFIACLFDDLTFVWRRIERDRDYEASIIAQEEDFWVNYVVAGVEPEYTEKPDLVLASIRQYYGHANLEADEVQLPASMIKTLVEYEKVKLEKEGLEKSLKAVDERLKALSAPIRDTMGTACKAVCKLGSNDFTVTFKPTYRDVTDTKAIKAQYPEVYNEFTERREYSRPFSVKRNKTKVEKSAS